MQSQFSLKKLVVSTVVVTTALFLAGCASGPKINTDYDHTVDFSKFKTYGFFNPMGIENANYSSIYGSIFRDAISQQMESRGYIRSENPDLMINVSGRLNEKTQVTQTTDPYMMGGYYGYRAGYYAPWGGYGFGSQTYVSTYTEGTVNIDLVDRVEKRMVWEGVGVGRVKENKSNEEVRANITASIQDMFSAYPFRAGEN